MKLLHLIFLFPVLLLIACNDDDDNNGGTTNTNEVYVTDNIGKTTVWYSDSVYIIDNHDFLVNAALTIQAGTVVKFGPGGLRMRVTSSGTVIAEGLANKPIVFTSIKDDKWGGDNNDDGGATQPNPGDWHSVLVESNSNIFSYCHFYYGGGGSYMSSLELYGSDHHQVTFCHFVKNMGGKSGSLYYGALDASSAGKNTVIENNVFYGNDIPLSINVAISLNNTNSFANPDSVAEKNTMNGIFTQNADNIKGPVIWAETEVPFVISHHDLWIVSPGSLTLGSNAGIKFTPESVLIKGQGASLIQNTTNYFTSFKDDNRGGDTNGDGAVTTPNPGDWLGIYDDFNSQYYGWPNIHYSEY